MLRNYPILLLFIATCLWGGNFVVGRELVASIPPFTLALFRWTIAMLVALPLYGPKIVLQRSLYLRRWRTILFLAVTGVAAFNTLLYIAVQYTGSINASLMNSATPVFIMLLSAMFLKERVNALSLAGVALSICGVLWIITRGSWSTLTDLSFNRGDLWMIAAVGVWALYSVGTKRWSGEFHAGGLLTVTIVISVVLLLPFALAEWLTGRTPPLLSLGQAAGVLYIGIFASIAAFTAWNTAVSILGPGRCGIYLNLIPLFSALFATLFTGETLHLYHVIGGCLVIGGIWLTARLNRLPRMGTA